MNDELFEEFEQLDRKVYTLELRAIEAAGEYLALEDKYLGRGEVIDELRSDLATIRARYWEQKVLNLELLPYLQHNGSCISPQIDDCTCGLTELMK